LGIDEKLGKGQGNVLHYLNFST